MAQGRRDEDQPGLDPIALALAVWLGVITGSAGLVRMSQDAAAQTALAQRAQQSAQMQGVAGAAKAVEPTPLFSPRLMAFGG